MKKPIKNIVFDISEVVLTGIKEASFALIEKHKIDKLTHHDLGWNKRDTPLSIPLLEAFFHGEITEDEYIDAVLKDYPQIGTREELKQHIRDHFREIEGTRDIIIELRGLGYRMALLSVHSKEWVEYCEEKFRYHELFDVRVYSHETKTSKPNPLAFKSVLEKLDAMAEECLFIDDQQRNIDGAQALGIPAVLFKDAKDLRTELSRLLPDFKMEKEPRDPIKLR